MRTILIGLATLAMMASACAETIGNCPVTDYGNGVYYLKCTEVGPALAELRGKNPNSIITMSYYINVFAGNPLSQGYYVIVNSPAK